jgi:hypothetical protein
MDCRVKPGNDDVALFRSSPAMTMWALFRSSPAMTMWALFQSSPGNDDAGEPGDDAVFEG